MKLAFPLMLAASFAVHAEGVSCASGKLSEAKIEGLLSGGVPLPRVGHIARACGISFPVTPSTAVRLRRAGADSILIAALRRIQPEPPAEPRQDNPAGSADPSRAASESSHAPQGPSQPVNPPIVNPPPPSTEKAPQVPSAGPILNSPAQTTPNTAAPAPSPPTGQLPDPGLPTVRKKKKRSADQVQIQTLLTFNKILPGKGGDQTTTYSAQWQGNCHIAITIQRERSTHKVVYELELKDVDAPKMSVSPTRTLTVFPKAGAQFRAERIDLATGNLLQDYAIASLVLRPSDPEELQRLLAHAVEVCQQ